ncbi:MAG: translational GTPase TypA, partial [Vallitaleaceae bacterium]|nr:translational GTPase TypA [Vallitaleaceae bacterium]
VMEGTIHPGDIVAVAKRDGSVQKAKIGKTFINVGLKRTEVSEVVSGDIVTISGISDISIGETICAEDNVRPLPLIEIEEPTLSMNFYVNNSPFAGKVGKFVTTRHIKARLEKELETNVGLKVEEIEGTDAYKVSGRGELHLSILIENMRREGYELSVSKPEVLLHEIDGKKQEPFERVIITAPDEYIGGVISKLNLRKGMMDFMLAEYGHTRIEYIVPTRGLLGYRSEFINDTRGEGIMVRSFDSYQDFVGTIPGRLNGVLISQEAGTTMAYSLFNLSDRGKLFVGAALEVYEGMIIGMNNRKDDMVVNPCKNKKLTNTRASGSDDAIKLMKPKEFTLEEALEFIEDDEWVEITPNAIRLRKRFLDTAERNRFNRTRSMMEEASNQ